MARLPGAFKQVQGMGTPIAIYPLRHAFLIRVGGLFLTLVCIFGGVAVTGLAGLDAYTRYYHHGPAVIWRGLGLPLVLAVLLLVVGIYIAAGTIRRWPKMLALYDQGIVVRDQDGLATLRWGEVASLRIDVSRRTFAGITLSSTKKIYLVRQDGERLGFDGDIRDADEALDSIRARLLPILYERFEPDFEGGQAFVFGPVELQRDQGVRMKQNTMPWQSIQKAVIEQGKLELSASEANGKVKQVSVPTAEIPNLDLLMAFIRQVKPAI